MDLKGFVKSFTQHKIKITLDSWNSQQSQTMVFMKAVIYFFAISQHIILFDVEKDKDRHA